MADDLCPQCGSIRQPGNRYCGTCAFDFATMLVDVVPPGDAPDSRARAPAIAYIEANRATIPRDKLDRELTNMGWSAETIEEIWSSRESSPGNSANPTPAPSMAGPEGERRQEGNSGLRILGRFLFYGGILGVLRYSALQDQYANIPAYQNSSTVGLILPALIVAIAVGLYILRVRIKAWW
jgi:hypothetical protein